MFIKSLKRKMSLTVFDAQVRLLHCSNKQIKKLFYPTLKAATKFFDANQ